MRRRIWLWWAAAAVGLFADAGSSFATHPSGVKVIVVARHQSWAIAAKLAVGVEHALTARNVAVVDPSTKRFDPTDLDYLGFRKAGRIALRRYRAGRYSRAIVALRAAISRLEKLMVRYGAVPLLMNKYVRAHYFLGAAHLKVADAAAAARAFDVASFFAPKSVPSQRRFGREVVAAYRRARASSRSRTGTVILRNHRRARVFLDGQAVGVAPMAVKKVPVGRHFLSLYRVGYLPVRRFIDVDASGFISTPTIMPDPNGKALRALVTRAERELRQKQEPGSALAALAGRLFGTEFVFCRASVDDAEASWYLTASRSFKKRVRRPNPVPGRAADRDIVSALWLPKPRYDLGQALAAACLTDDDCPGGKCIAGKCVREHPFYKRWWFWVAVGAGVAAAATAGALVATMPEKPIVRITTPP